MIRALDALALSVGSAGEQVTVESAAMAVAPEHSGERSDLLTTQEIERLPIQSRKVSELLRILPGVTSTADGAQNGVGFDFSDAGSSGSAIGVGLNTNGAPYRHGTAYLLYGADIIDPGCACWSIATVNPDLDPRVLEDGMRDAEINGREHSAQAQPLKLNVRLSVGETMIAEDRYAVVAGEVHRRIAFLNHPLPGYANTGLVTLNYTTTNNQTFTPVANPKGGVTDAKYTQRTMLLAAKYTF